MFYILKNERIKQFFKGCKSKINENLNVNLNPIISKISTNGN